MAEVITGARAYIDVPAPPVQRGGVLSIANVIDNPDVHALMGAVYLTDACATAEEWTEWCTMSPTGVKDFAAGPDVVEGDPFVIYAGVSCDLQNVDEAKARAVKRLDYAERRMVDAAVVRWLGANADVTDAAVYALPQAIGSLEDIASSVYGGQLNILLPMAFMACACGLTGPIQRDPMTGDLITCNGSKAASFSYHATFSSGLTVPPLAAAAVFATGQITLLRGAVESFSVPQQIDTDGTFAPMRALAERVYVPLIECVALQVAANCS